MLTSKAVHEVISSILESLSTSDLDGAKRKLQSVGLEVRSERDRGSLLAAAGIYTSLSKAKGGTLGTWEHSRIERAASSISSSQMADEFDQGYAETLVNYSKLTQKTA